MGTINVVGGFSGQTYTLNIDGDQPTATEAQRAQAFVRQQEDAFRQNYETQFGPVQVDDGTALGRGWDVGKTSAYSALGTTARDVGEATGLGWLASLGQGMEESARQEQIREAATMPAPTRWEDVQGLGGLATYAGELAGQSGPEMAATLGATVGGTLLGGPVGGFAAGTTTAMPFFYGRNIQRQEDTGADVDRLNAFLAAGGQSVLNTIGDKLLIGKLAAPGQRLFTRVVRGAAQGAATEVPTEVTQQILERWQAGLPLDDEEAMREYIDAGVGAGILGAAAGGVGGPFRAGETPVATPKVPVEEDVQDKLQLPAPERTTTLGLPAPDVLTALPAGEATPQLTAPGTSEARPASETTGPVVTPIQEGQSRADGSHVPALSADAAATARSLGSDPQMLAAAKAIEDAGKATVKVIQDAMGLSYSAATGLMKKLENVGAVSKFEKGVGRTLTLPFKVSATAEPAVEPVSPTVELPEAPTPATAEEIAVEQAAKPTRRAKKVQAEPTPVGEQPDGGTNIEADGAGVPADQQRVAVTEPGGAGQSAAGTPAPQPAGLGEPVRDTAAPTRAAREPSDTVTGERRIPADMLVEPAEIEQRKATLAETRETPAAPVDTAAPIPGRTLGTAGQVIPEGIPGVQRPSAAQTAQTAEQITQRAELEQQATALKNLMNSRRRLTAQAKATGVKRSKLAADTRAQYNAIKGQLAALGTPQELANTEQEAAKNLALRNQLRTWYTKNAPADVQSYDADIRGETAFVGERGDAITQQALKAQFEQEIASRDPSTSADKQTLLDLLSMPAQALKKDPAARAAHAYFSKTRDLADALENIAFDKASPDVPSRRRGAPKQGAPLEGYWQGTGKTVAEKAAKWVQDNMSGDVADYMASYETDYAIDNAEATSAAIDKGIMDARKRTEEENAFLKSYEDAAKPDWMQPLTKDRVKRDADTAKLTEDLSGVVLRDANTSIAYGLDAPLHPAIVKALNTGNLRAALRGIAATNVDPYIQNLAGRLVEFVGDTKVYVTDSGETVTNLLRNPQDPTIIDRGGYLLMSEAEYDKMAETSPEAAMDLQNSILLNSDTGMNVHTILHETLHAATARELENPASPVRARLQSLFDQVSKDIEGEYGATNLNEFVAEALSNQDFQQMLDRHFPNQTKLSAWEQFKRIVQNFVRRIMGRQPKAMEFDTVLDEVDYLTKSILATAPEFAGSDPLYSQAMRPLSAREAMSRMAGKQKLLTPQEQYKLDAVMQNARIPLGVKTFINDALVPLRNMTEYARKYFPMADRAYQLVTEHNAAIRKTNDRIRETVAQISDYLTKTPDQLDNFNELRMLGSLYEIDVRRPRTSYSKFTLAYRNLKADGTLGDRVVEEFDNLRDRTARIGELNKDDAAKRTKARKLNDPDKEVLAVYDHLRSLYKGLGADGQKAYGQALGLFSDLHKEAARVFKARLEAMMPGQRRLQEAVYKQIFDKLFTEKSLDAYQPLQREGRYWLYFEAKDPVTGDNTPYKMAFPTAADRTAYSMELQALPAEAGVKASTIQEYMKIDSTFFEQARPSSKFVADVGGIVQKQAIAQAERARTDALDAGKTQAEADAAYNNALAENTAQAGAVQQQIVELALNMMPERSFLQSYKKRQGTRGFIGDIDPLRRKLGKTDTTNLLLRKGSSLSRQLADMEFGAKASTLRQEMADHYGNVAPTLPVAEQETMRSYYDSISRSMQNIYVDRHPVVKALNSLTYMMTLGFNPSSSVMNVMAVPTITLPFLGGKYGMMSSAKAYRNAFKALGQFGLVRDVEYVTETGARATHQKKLSRADYSLENGSFGEFDQTRGYANGDNAQNRYKFLRDVALDRGMFVDTIAYDTLDVEGMTGQGLWLKFNKMGGFMMHQTEKLVRETTMIAAYDLELQRIAKSKGTNVLTEADMQAAAQEAIYNTELATGTIAAAGAPNLSQRGLMPLMYMFKRYPLGVYNMLATLMNKSFQKPDAALKESDPQAYEAAMEARKIARMQFAMVVGNVGLWAGAAGLPMYGALAGIADALFKDDDEESFDTMVRRTTGELGFKGLGNYLFGIEMSSRIGMANMFYREPLRAENNPPLWNLLEGAGGPIIGLTNTWLTRVPDLWSQGEYYRALEAASPSILRNTLRSLRFANEGGAESLRGDLIADVSVAGQLGQLLGFAPAEYIRQIEINSQLKDIDTAIGAEKSALLRRLNLARGSHNTLAIADTMEAIREFNRKNPQDQISTDTISRSAKAFQNTTRDVRNGVIFSDRNRAMLDRMARDLESDVTIWDTLGLR